MATYIEFETSMVMGNFTMELYTKHAPRTCYNIAELSKIGYYNDTIFHRIIRDFIIQGGDPTGTGALFFIEEKSIPINKYQMLMFSKEGAVNRSMGKFEDEIVSDLKHTGAGILSMANAGPNTNGSQFFITLAPSPWLDGKHTIFGRISSGMKVIQRIASVPTDSQDSPLTNVKIIKANIVS